MTRLRGLAAEAHVLVTPELIHGQTFRVAEEVVGDYLEDLDGGLELGAFNDVVDEAVRRFGAFDAAVDAWLAPRVHRALPLQRRAAAEPGPWRYLTVVLRPDFIRHRWKATSLASMRRRFWLPGTRHDSNAFARLWWIAELSRDGDDYAITETIFKNQSLATTIFVRSLSQYSPATRALARALADASSEVIEATMRKLSIVLGTEPLEGFDEEELTRLVREMMR